MYTRHLFLMISTSVFFVAAQDANGSVTAPNPTGAPIDRICRINDGRIGISGDRIYLVNSEVVFTNSIVKSSDAFFIDLTESSLLEEPFSDAQQFDIDPSVPHRRGPGPKTFWYDNTTLYAFGGADPAMAPSNELWALDAGTATWKTQNITGDKLQGGILDRASFTSDAEYGVSFSTGEKGSLARGGIIRFNASGQGDPEWSVLTQDQDSRGSKREGAQIFFVPVGKEGSLVSLGGSIADEVVSLAEIDVYDISSKTWFEVNLPERSIAPRKYFCGWVTRAQDFSSYQITVYGGWIEAGHDDSDSRGYEDVYVLTMPLFEWTSGMQIGGNAEYGGGSGRRGHSCLKYGTTGGYVVGGFLQEGNSVTRRTCDTAKAPLRLIDLSTFAWQSQMTEKNEAPYEIPEDVLAKIGGSALGGATATRPVNGWPTGLEEVFKHHVEPPK